MNQNNNAVVPDRPIPEIAELPDDVRKLAIYDLVPNITARRANRTVNPVSRFAGSPDRPRQQ